MAAIITRPLCTVSNLHRHVIIPRRLSAPPQISLTSQPRRLLSLSRSHGGGGGRGMGGSGGGGSGKGGDDDEDGFMFQGRKKKKAADPSSPTLPSPPLFCNCSSFSCFNALGWGLLLFLYYIMFLEVSTGAFSSLMALRVMKKLVAHGKSKEAKERKLA